MSHNSLIRLGLVAILSFCAVGSADAQVSLAAGTLSQGKYALGRGEIQLDWAPGPLVYHGGSNEKNLAHIWLEPQRDFAMVLVTNIGGSKASEALNALAPELYSRFAISKAAPRGVR